MEVMVDGIAESLRRANEAEQLGIIFTDTEAIANGIAESCTLERGGGGVLLPLPCRHRMC
jgi:hypothetical protein